MDGRGGSVQVAQHLGVGLDLRREEAAELGECCGRVDVVGVGGLVVDDPPAVFAFCEGIGPGAKDAVYANGAQGSGDNAGPTDFAGRFEVGR